MSDDLGSGEPQRDVVTEGVAVPQRYSVNYRRYRDLGGLVELPEDATAFAGGERLQDAERFFFLSLVFDQIRKESVEGDFAELGVYRGDTAAVLARHARRLERTLYLLDTFEGFDDRDLIGVDSGGSKVFADTSLDAVRERVGEERTQFISGYFPDTATQLPANGLYALVHLDADLYLPILSALQYFYPRMAAGGFIIVHDYNSLAWAGAEKAVDQFFADKPEAVVPIPDNAGSIVVRLARDVKKPGWVALKRTLASGRWRGAALGDLAQFLVEGWSLPEDWGVWGVGAAHRLVFAVDDEGAIRLHFDVAAFIPADQSEREVEVWTDGRFSNLWVFDHEHNRAVRTVALPPRASAHEVEFRPRRIVTPSEFEPGSTDGRTLGLALHRIRATPLV